MNNIPQTQNLSTSIKKLAAMRELYSFAKTIFGISVFLSVICLPFFVVISTKYNIVEMQPYIAFFSIIIALYNVISDFWIKRVIDQAAKIQEKFDCEVLGLEWNRFKIGPEPSVEKINDQANKHFQKHKDGKENLQNWYYKYVGEIKFSLGRIICQRSNCSWETKLRFNYIKIIVATLVVIVALTTLSLIMFSDKTKDAVVFISISIMPAIILLTQTIAKNYDSLQVSKHNVESAITILNDATTGEVEEKKLYLMSRTLQDQIFDHRRTSPLIFDWVYKLSVNKDEKLMNESVEQLIVKYKKNQES